MQPYAVRAYTNASGSTSFRVEGRRNGKRIRKNFADPGEAGSYCDNLNSSAFGAAMVNRGQLTRTTLTADELRSAEMAAADGRWRLEDVIRIGLEALDTRAKPILLEPLAEKWLPIIRQEVSVRWFRDLNARVKKFLTTHPGITADKFDGALARAWLDQMQRTPTTRRNYRSALHRWADWLKEGGYVAENPFADITIRTPRGGAHKAQLPGVLAPTEARALIQAARETEGGQMLGWFALSLFGGLRPYAEAQHRQWSEINLRTGEISALGRKRGARVRIFKAQPVLIKWLQLAKKTGALLPGYFERRLRERIIDRANAILAEQCHPAIDWDGDIMRHSYASYRTPFVSVVDLAKEMGTSTTMIYAHYMHPRPKAEAVEFWKIEP